MFTSTGKAKCQRCGRFLYTGHADILIKPWSADMPEEERMDVVHKKDAECPSAKHLWKKKKPD